MARAASLVVIALASACAAPSAAPSATSSTVAARCAMPVERASSIVAPVDPVPRLALARGPADIGLAFVERVAFPRLAQFQLQRVGLDGGAIGVPITMSPVDMASPGSVTITRDGPSYLACTIVVGGASCFRVDDAGASTEAGMVLDAIAIAIASGAGGVMGAWSTGDEIRVGPLDGTGVSVASTNAAPSIASTDTGYVVGYVAGGMAFVVLLDASGGASTPIALGAASDTVVVAFAGERVGASWVDASGQVMAATVSAGVVHATPIDGATSLGQVGIARASDGFFATWSDTDGTIGGRFVDLPGATSGMTFALPVDRDDAAHAVLGLPNGFLLATNTTANATPVHLALVGCL